MKRGMLGEAMQGEKPSPSPVTSDKSTDVLVLGAGIVGITTAYALARRGFSVTIADREAGPAQGASFANGAQLSYAYTDALAQPSLLRKMPFLFAGLDPAFRVRLSLDPDFFRWGLAFLQNCTQAQFDSNTLATLRLGLESQAAMADLRERHPFDFAHTVPGKMHIFRDEGSLNHSRTVAALKRSAGVKQEILTSAQAVAIEPALHDAGPIAGALWTPSDEIGDPYGFCKGLLAVLVDRYGVKTAFRFSAAQITQKRDAVIVVDEEGNELSASNVVVCFGAQTPRLLAPLGIRPPIVAMKGYSFTALPGKYAPTVSITDAARKIVYCRLGNSMRVAGLAELNNNDPAPDPARLRHLIDQAKAAMPYAVDYETIGSGWAGLRPMTPNSQPVISQAKQRIFLNVGHGMLGWTLAAGSAERVSALVEQSIGQHLQIRKAS
ncbi:FAD-dependent oxidoreductase [Tsuneonella suprasediminis]|uniref:FAD-dependent oxidoreductase n=1 Tax=Tsuneonella suprasediminis TaxID=2306996 RepID=UPI002F939DE7